MNCVMLWDMCDECSRCDWINVCIFYVCVDEVCVCVMILCVMTVVQLKCVSERWCVSVILWWMWWLMWCMLKFCVCCVDVCNESVYLFVVCEC